jgi:hypothetical protein
MPPGFPSPLPPFDTSGWSISDIVADAILSTDRTWSGEKEAEAVLEALGEAGYKIVKSA